MRLILFTADAWQHVCPMLRIVEPVRQAGWELIQGSEWQAGQMQVFPERVSAADVVIIQRDFPRQVEAHRQVVSLARDSGKVLIYEIDDLLTELDPAHPDYHRYTSARSSMLATMVEADAVSCSTPTMQAYIRQFNPNTWVLPNYLDDHLWRLPATLEQEAQTSQAHPLVIGYLGSPSHKADLEMITPALEHLLAYYADRIMLRLWGIPAPAALADRPNVEWLDLGLVDYARFADYFSRQQCDIFIAPLRDNLFNRCKSWIKYLEYSALAIPGVYSRIAPYEVIIRHGENGFLASDLDEWKQHLSRLVENPALRHQMGLAAHATLRKDWLLSGHISEWKATFQDMITSAQHNSRHDPAHQIASKLYTWHLDSQNEIETLKDMLAAEEQKTQSLNRRVDEKNYLLQIYNQQLEAISHSAGWRLLEVLYRLRLTLAPRDSYREHLLQLAIQSLRILKNEGLCLLTTKWMASIRAKNTQAILGKEKVASTPAAVRAEQGLPCPSPAISVVIEDNNLLPQLDQEKILAWVRNQTLKSVEVVIWHRSRDNAQVIPMDAPTSVGRAWDASDLQDLLGGLGGRYLCMASNDLLEQSQTYLECNLVALEGEALVFTVNTKGVSGWATRHLHLHRLPGDRLRPLFRQIVRKEYVKQDYSIDLSLWTHRMDGLPSVAGKLITHTTSSPEIGESFPLETQTGEVDLALQGKHILTRTRLDLPWDTTHTYRTIDSVMPSTQPTSNLPTVFLAMTFLAVGGAEQLALNLINGLKDKIRFVILGAEELDPALGTLSDAFRQLTPLVYNMADCSAPPSRLSFLYYLIDNYQPVSLYIANGAAWLYDALSEIKKRYPDLWTVNQVYDYQAGWINRYDPGLLLYMDAHIGANERICKAYIEKGARPEQVHLIEHGIDPTNLDSEAYTLERIRHIKSKLGLPQDSQVVTFASRIHPQKRPMDFVELARRFLSDQATVFLMMGDGPLTGIVEDQATRIGLNNFYRKPFYRPIGDILAISDVVVLPSEYEGMPLIIAEAQVMGKPVVVTDVGNNRQVLEITGGGVIVPRIGDIEALAIGVRRMLAVPPDPGRMRQALLDHFGIQVIAKKYHDLLIRHTDA